MRRILLFALLAAAVLSAAAPAEAQRRRYRDYDRGPSIEGLGVAGFHLGFSSPTGDFDDAFDSGIGFGGTLGYGVSRSVLLSVNVSHHEFDHEFFNDEEVSITPITFNADYVIPTGGSITPWVGGGIGAYNVNDQIEGLPDLDETTFGVNIGAGIAGFVARRTVLGGGFRWHSVSGDELPDSQFFTFQVGLGFLL